ncbi:4-hydroxy-3-methylbut-2-enyl diphosphate reductase [Streptomyces sp. NPDC059477]|uniref:4-hydroxy-3-methylbut-2-enyl diphosphate reductase n=1 Tax=Streptomyces sp. NPDC059477 TaxID=3346847 RepID=UPI00367AA2A4
MIGPEIRTCPAVLPAPALAPGEVLVATEVTPQAGPRAPCPAAPLAAAELERAGARVRTAPVTLLPEGATSTVRLVMAEAATGAAARGPVLACGALVPAGHRAEGTPIAPDRRAWGLAWNAVETWARLARPRTVLLAAPRSFCAGVERAIETVESLLDQYAPAGVPVFVRKQIVHNTHVVRDLERRGAVFVEELDEVPDGGLVVFSAHGVSPAVRTEAERRGLGVVDATCPLVTKVHAEARRFAERGSAIVLIGHAGHEEVEGTFGEAPQATILVQDTDDVAALDLPADADVAYLTQTTLAVDETAEVIDALGERFENLRAPLSQDICYATTNRQLALRAVAAESDLVLVIGSPNSSNSVRLVELCRREGTMAQLIEDVSAIRPGWLEAAARIGLTAGASAPPALVDDVIAALRGLGPVTVDERTTTVETVRFAPPSSVRPR